MRGFVLLAFLAGIVGCGGKTAPVNGRVKLKNGGDVSALAGYSVTFESAEGNMSGVGDIKPDGTFRISTFGADDGAVPGKYRVAIGLPPSSDPDKPPPKSKLAAKYADPASSSLTVEIKSGRNDVLLELDGAP